MPTEYPKPDKPPTTATAEDWLDEIHALAETAGVTLPAALAEGREAIDRCQRFRREMNERRESRADLARRLARSLAAGELDLDGVVAEAATREQLTDGSVAKRAVALAEDVAIKRAWDNLGEEIDGDDVLDQCRTIAAETVDAIHDLRPVLDGIRDGDQAAARGQKVARAWSVYRSELLPRWEAAHELVKRLRRLAWVKPLPVGLGGGPYAQPKVIAEHRRNAKRGGEPLRGLLDPIYDEAGVGGPFTEAEAREHQRAREAAASAAAEREADVDARLREKPRVAA